MDISFKGQEGCKKTFTVSAPWSDVEPKFADIARKLRARVNLPGFRPGKAPESMIRRRYRKEITEEVLDQLLPDAAKAMVEGEGVDPVVEPYAEAVHLVEGEDFTCDLVAEVAPEVPAIEAADVTIEVPKTELKDEQVEGVLENLRQKAAVMKTMEGAAEEGDFAVVTMRRAGQSKGQERYMAALSKSDNPAERELLGKKAGDEFAVTVEEADPEGEEADHGDNAPGHTHLAPGEYAFSVKKVARREVPALDDDLAKDLGAESLETLRKKVREDLAERMERESKSLQEDHLIDTLLEKNPFDVPPTLVDRQLREDLRAFAEQIGGQGVDLEKANLDWTKMAETRRPVAERKVAAYYMLGKVAQDNGLEAGEDDLEKYFAEQTKGTSVTVEAFRKRVEKDGALDSVKTAVSHKKALDLLLSQASVTLTEGKSEPQED